MATGTLITTPFGFESTAAEVVDGVDLTGRRAIVTGGASGIGVETARALAGAGAEVTLAVRDTGPGDRTAADIKAHDRPRRPRRAGSTWPTRRRSPRSPPAGRGPLHILVNNAGVMAVPGARAAPEGWELQFATNHLGHFALATRPARRARRGRRRARRLGQLGRAPALAGRSSTTCTSRFRPYDPWLAYGQSKTANVLFAVEADRRWARRRHPRQRADAGRDRHQPAAAHRPGADRERAARAASPLQDRRAGRRDLGAAGRVPAASRASAAATSRTATRPRS